MKKYSARKPMVVGVFALTALLLGIVVWGSMTRIAGAIVAFQARLAGSEYSDDTSEPEGA